MKDVAGCLRTVAAAAYLGLAPDTLCNYRTRDRNAVANGEAPRGPRFLMICNGTRCVYRIADLDAWLESTAKKTAKADDPKRGRPASKHAGAR